MADIFHYFPIKAARQQVFQAIATPLWLALLLHLAVGRTTAQVAATPSPDEAKVKRQIAEWGMSQRRYLLVQLADGRKLRGLVQSAGDTAFEFRTDGTPRQCRQQTCGERLSLTYAQVKKVQRTNSPTALPLGTFLLIGIGVIVLGVSLGR